MLLGAFCLARLRFGRLKVVEVIGRVVREEEEHGGEGEDKDRQ